MKAPHPKVCKHENTVLHTSGTRWFSWGDVDDNLENHVICLDCMSELEDISISDIDDDLEDLPF